MDGAVIRSLALALPIGACSFAEPTPHVIPNSQADWRQVATTDDRGRVRDWRESFSGALKAARAAGHGAELAREPVLFDPDAALPGGEIPNGAYRCRVIKLGAKSEGLLDYVAYPFFQCRIEQQGALQHFAKLTGSQRQVGLIFPSDGLRQVFLGTLVLGDEARAMRYGMDEQRDVAGLVERIGPARWRMVMPRPHFESQTDVMELIPVAQESQQ